MRIVPTDLEASFIAVSRLSVVITKINLSYSIQCSVILHWDNLFSQTVFFQRSRWQTMRCAICNVSHIRTIYLTSGT
jgi:hypothetical protein